MYKTRAGDTFATVSRRAYGTEVYADRVRYANPGTSEPFTEGVVLATPTIPGAPKNPTSTPSANSSDEVALLVDGQRFRYWSEMQITRQIDSIDTIDLVAPFDPNDTAMRRVFKPFTFPELVVTVGGLALISGTLVRVQPSLDADSNIVNASGYATPGVLADCMAPPSSYPLEFEGQNLAEILFALCSPLGIDFQTIGDAGPPFERVTCESTDQLWGFMTGLAAQRGGVLRSSTDGALLFTREADVGTPDARLTQGAAPLISVTPRFDAQRYYSHVTGIEPTDVGIDGSQYTVKNPRLSGVVRPFAFTIRDAKGADVQTATESKAGRMFGNSAAYTVEVSTWRDDKGRLWAPDGTVQLKAPGVMVYDYYSFKIRSVTFTATKDKRSAVLELTIPGAFGAKTPESLPWE